MKVDFVMQSGKRYRIGDQTITAPVDSGEAKTFVITDVMVTRENAWWALKAKFRMWARNLWKR